MEDGQNIKTDKAQKSTNSVQLELIFLLLLIQPSGKLSKP